jgi:predicted nucleic acid-binding protein
MRRLVLADTGPLVALFHEDDAAHHWALARFREFTEPLLTCEAVLTEAIHLLRKVPPAHANLLSLWERDLLRVGFSAEDEKDAIPRLLRRFADVPISFADSGMVRMSEIHAACVVWTLDSDFRVYRRSGRQSIPLVIPYRASDQPPLTSHFGLCFLR